MLSHNVSLSIDKVGVRYAYPLTEQGHEERLQLNAFKKSLIAGDLGNPGQAWASSKHAMTNLSISLKGGSTLSIRYGYCSKRQWSWLTFNPSRLTSIDYAELRAYMDMLFQQGWQTLWDHGDLARLDIACDVQANVEDYLYVDQVLQVEDNHGTRYLGAMKGARHLRIYDKRKERIEVAGIDLGHPLLRIEATILKPKQHRFGEMLQVHNPFLPVHVIDRERLAASELAALNKIKTGIAQGLTPVGCLAWHKGGERKAAFEALPAVAPSWWRPSDIWKSYPETFDWVHALLA